jgi:hypothetical protein
MPQPKNIEWWGVSTGETDANNSTYANYAISASFNNGPLYVNGYYGIDVASLKITISTSRDTLHIEGRGWKTGFEQKDALGQEILEVTTTGADTGYTDLILKHIKLVGNAACGDGLVLRRTNGLLENVYVSTVGGSAFSFLGCADGVEGMQLWADTADIGFKIGCYHSATQDNSTNASNLTGLWATSCVTSGLLFEADGTYNLRPKGNGVYGFTYGGGSTAKVIHFKGGNENLVLNPWCEDGDYGLYFEDDATGTEYPDHNTIINPRLTVNATANIEMAQGRGNMVIGGYMPSPAVVTLAAGCDYNKFLYLRNFPGVPGKVGTLTDSGTGNSFDSLGIGGSDATYPFRYQGFVFRNAYQLKWYDTGNTMRNVLELDSSDRTVLRGPEGTAILRISNTTELPSFLAALRLLSTNGNIGTFTAGAAATTDVANTAVLTGCKVFIFPTNAAAGTLMAGADSLYVSAVTAGVGFTVATAGGGNAAGTETFNYLIFNNAA